MKFLERLQQGPLLADGAMGTMLHQLSASIDMCFDALNLTDPALVANVHRAFIDAGAQLIETNTFSANCFKLSSQNYGDRVEEINLAAVTLARRAVDASFKPIYIAGSV